MKILVDADACPNAIKEIIFRASKRLKIAVILFANHPIAVPKIPLIKFVQVPKGFDEADREIEKMVEQQDLVITADIPLANAVIDKHATALNPRGTLYTKENIKEKLQMRNFMDELRSTGQNIGGPSPLDKTSIQNFANALDRVLNKKIS